MVQNWQSWISLEQVDQVFDFLLGERLPPEAEGVAEEEKVLLVDPVQVLHILWGEARRYAFRFRPSKCTKRHVTWLGISDVIIQHQCVLKLELGLNGIPARRAAQSTEQSVPLQSCPRAGARSAAPRTLAVCGWAVRSSDESNKTIWYSITM